MKPLGEHKVYRPAERELDEAQRIKKKYGKWLRKTGGWNMLATSVQEGTGPFIWIGFPSEAEAESLAGVIPNDLEGVPVLYSIVGEIWTQAEVEA